MKSQRPRRNALSHFRQARLQLIKSRTCPRAHGNNRRVFEKRSGDQFARFVFNQREHLFVDQILFGDHDETIAHAEQTTDVEVLARLRHHTFVSSDHQREQIDTVRSGQHVFDEAFVTGNVDETEAQIVEFEIGKAEIDRDAASFFFRKAVGIDAGQSAHEGALSVIDVTGGADDQRRH